MLQEAGIGRFRKKAVQTAGAVAAGMLAFAPGFVQHSSADLKPFTQDAAPVSDLRNEFDMLPGVKLRYMTIHGDGESFSDSKVFMGPGAEYQLGQFWRDTLRNEFPDNIEDSFQDFVSGFSDTPLPDLGFPNAMALAISQRPMPDNGIVGVDDTLDAGSETPLAIVVQGVKLQPDGNLVVFVRSPEEICDSDGPQKYDPLRPGSLIGIDFGGSSVNSVSKITIMRDRSCAAGIGQFGTALFPDRDNPLDQETKYYYGYTIIDSSGNIIF